MREVGDAHAVPHSGMLGVGRAVMERHLPARRIAERRVELQMPVVEVGVLHRQSQSPKVFMSKVPSPRT
jgi:hypothetical protein